MIEAAVSAFKLPDLRRKILFTLGLLIVFRLLAHVPIPGVDLEKLRVLFQQSQLLGMFDLFSGGAMSTFSVAAMGVYPYITASIIMQLLIPVIPRLTELSKEGEYGRQRINQYTHWLTVPLAALQGIGQVSLLQSQGIISNFDLLRAETFLPSFAIVCSLVAGTVFLIWLGELITEYGVGNGVSIIIFSGIVARLPTLVGRLLGGTAITNLAGLVAFALLGLLTVAGIVLIQEGTRRIPVQYARRVRGSRVYGGVSTHIPLKVNSAGMIPLIFAISVLISPSILASYVALSPNPTVRSVAEFVVQLFQPTSLLYQVLYFWLVVAFTYFYTIVLFSQQNIAENLQKTGGFVPGIRPGRPTAEYLNKVLMRITLVGALFLGAVAVMPYFAGLVTGVTALNLSSTALLIVVGVAIDTMRQLEAQLMMRHYEGFLR